MDELLKNCVVNPHEDNGYDGRLWETYGPQVDYVRAQPNNLVWSLVDGEDGPVVITGFHHVNAIGYFVSKTPWTEEREITLDQ